MKNRPAPVLWMATVTAALLPLTAVAQVPFSSTQSPGLGPFNRGAAAAAPLPSRQASSPAPLGAYNGMANGTVPAAMAVTGPIDPDHKIGPRDVLSYRVSEDRENEDHQLTVTDSGEVVLPIGGLRVKAAGKTPQQLTGDIKSALEREFYRPGHATVALGLLYTAPNASKGRVFFSGEVKGAIDLPADGELTVVQAILQLGGFTLDADQKRVFIYRKGGSKKGIQVNGKAVLNGDSSKDVVLQPGDTVKVERKWIGVQF